MTEHVSNILDDLDIASKLLNDEDAEATDQEIVYALKAIAHVLLWNAEQQRNWQRKHAEAARAAEEWRANQPPPMPAFPMPYQGF